MKFIIFYTVYEWKRKPLRVLSMFMMIGIVLFCITNLSILLASNTNAYDLTDTDTPRNPFSSATFILLLASHFLLLLTGMLILSDNKRRHDSCENRVLKDLGVDTHKMILLQLFESTVAFLLACPIFVMLSVFFMRGFTEYINHRLKNEILSYRIPNAQVPFSLLFLLIAATIGTVLPYVRENRQPHISPNGTPDPRHSPAIMFWKMVHRRCRSQVRSTLIVLSVIQILPLIFLLAAISFGTVSEPMYDCTVSVNEQTKQLIPQSILEQVKQIDGIQKSDTLPDAAQTTGNYTIIKIKFDDNSRENGIQAVRELPTLEQYEFRNHFHAALQATVKNQVYRSFFVLIAGILFFATLILSFIILLSNFQNHNSNMSVLHTLGMNPRDIRRFYLYESLYQLLSGSVPSILIASIFFVIMETEGGGNVPFQEICVVSIGYLCAQTVLALVAAKDSYKRFLKKQLQKSFATRREWNEYHM